MGLPFEFSVSGIPLSAQASSHSRGRWQETVRAAAEAEWESATLPISGEVSVTIIYFFEGETDLDVDNIAKPILDALNGLIYEDDSQVSQLTIRKTQLAQGLEIDVRSLALANALDAGGDFVYVKVRSAPTHWEVP
jgi:crossover junction endodeoxyribonuclease RusA